MQIIDKYKYFKENLTFKINLENYISKYRVIFDKDDLQILEEQYSPRLFISDKHAIMIETKEVDEIKTSSILNIELDLFEKDTLMMEDLFIIDSMTEQME